MKHTSWIKFRAWSRSLLISRIEEQLQLRWEHRTCCAAASSRVPTDGLNASNVTMHEIATPHGSFYCVAHLQDAGTRLKAKLNLEAQLASVQERAQERETELHIEIDRLRKEKRELDAKV